MDVFLAIVLAIAAYNIVELILKHRERMAQLKDQDKDNQ